MLSAYLNQMAVYAPLTGLNNRGQPSYGPSLSIPCRKRAQTQEVITPDKRTVKCEYTYCLSQAVREGDLLDGRRVQMVKAWTMMDGQIIGYQAVT